MCAEVDDLNEIERGQNAYAVTGNQKVICYGQRFACVSFTNLLVFP